MSSIYACVWDKGEHFALNQDSFSLQAVYTGNGPYAMIILCDDGNYNGEPAAAGGYAVRIMTDWFYEHGLELLCRKASGDRIYRSCRRALGDVHLQLKERAKHGGTAMATCFSMLILTSQQYFYINVGGGSCYQIHGKNCEISNLHKKIPTEQKVVLGVEEFPTAVFKYGNYRKKDRFLLCSDGFERCASERGIKALGRRDLCKDEMEKLLEEIIIRGREKGERDSCTAIAIGRN